MDLPKEAYTAIGTVIGAIIALTGVFVSSTITRATAHKVEDAKLRGARLDSAIKELVLKVTQFASDLAAAAHSMCWLTWSSNHSALNSKKIDAYDAEMHAILPKVSGGAVAVGSLDEELGVLARELAEKVFELDAQLGHACNLFPANKAQAEQIIRDLTPAVLDFENVTLKRLSDA